MGDLVGQNRQLQQVILALAIIINKGECLWCCEHGTAIARVRPVYLMTVEQCQMAAHAWPKPTNDTMRYDTEIAFENWQRPASSVWQRPASLV